MRSPNINPTRETAVSLEFLERQICECAADLAAATCRWLVLVAEYDARGGWAEWGVKSCAHWLSWRCGIGLTAAREQTRVARALGALPLVSAYFATGELSYSKVRAITRVAQPETEAQLVEIARHATGAVLDRVVRGYAGVIRIARDQQRVAEEKQSLSCTWDDDGMLLVHGRLRPEDGAVLLKALEASDPDDPEMPRSVRQAQALVRLAEGGQVPRAEVVVHIDADTLAADGIVDRCDLEDGPTIAPETARRLGCDASLRTIIERDGKPLAVGRRTRAINPALKRALQGRDQGCRFPGCTHSQYLHAHHIEHWARGGKTDLRNLIQLCSHHHTLVHDGGYTVDTDDSGTPRFWNPQGWAIPATGEVTTMSGISLSVQNRNAGVTVNPDTCRPLSAGDRCDYGLAAEGLARRWLPPPGG